MMKQFGGAVGGAVIHDDDLPSQPVGRRSKKSCMQMDPTIGYITAFGQLNDAFGNEYRVAESYMATLSKWTPIKNEDSKAMQAFATYLWGCRNTMSGMSALNKLNGTAEMQGIVMKLPYDLRKKWRNIAFEKTSKLMPIYFSHLVDFIKREADLLSHPVFGTIQDTSSSNRYKEKDKSKGKKSFATSANSSSPKKSDKKTNSTKSSKSFSSVHSTKICVYCDKNGHHINTCRQFLALTMREKEDFVRSKYLCWNCLNVGHMSKFCTNKSPCGVNGCINKSISKVIMLLACTKIFLKLIQVDQNRVALKLVDLEQRF